MPGQNHFAPTLPCFVVGVAPWSQFASDIFRHLLLLAQFNDSAPPMKTSFLYVFRIASAWIFAFVLLLLVWIALRGDRGSPPSWPFVLSALLVIAWQINRAVSHLRRVQLIVGRVDAETLANRQRRQIEIPLDAGDAFDMLEATIRELPRSGEIETARGSLQVRAKVKRLNPYNKSPDHLMYRWFESQRDQISATISPGDSASSVTLICEPDSAAWGDWLTVDDATNFENAEAITRAITRRIAERRRGEQERAQQTATEKELTVAKLSLLHAQVEPHFLYNTLASAQILTRSDPARADEMLGNLILYLRHSLPRTEDTPSTLGKELERARAYLDILKIRMGARLNMQIDVPPALLAVPFPTMMLQTLVENAIKHGLEPQSGGGTIWILAREVDATIAVTVADDGRGFSAEGGGTGIGLKNIRERLHLAFGAAAKFAIVANFPNGVAATITVPMTSVEGADNV